VAYHPTNPCRVRISVFNAAAQKVAEVDDQRPAGPCTSDLDLSKCKSGVYLYKVELNYDGGASEKLPVKAFVVCH